MKAVMLSRTRAQWLAGAAALTCLAGLGLVAHELDRKAQSNVSRIDANLAALGAALKALQGSNDALALTASQSRIKTLGDELKALRGRTDTLEAMRALLAAQSADLENKFQALATRTDAAALGVRSSEAPSGPQTCQDQTFDTKVKLVCSKSFPITGTCGTPHQEMPPQWWGDLVWATVPWEPRPITVVGASVDLQGNGAYLGAFVGNSYTPDPVTPFRYALSNGTMVSLHNAMIFPAGSGMAFPGASPEKRIDRTARLDLHLYCAPKGSTYTGFVFVWYVPAAS